MNRSPDPRQNPVAVRRQRARRTALWLAAIALVVYVGFLLSGVFAQ